MRLVRVRSGGETSNGWLEGDEVRLIDGELFDVTPQTPVVKSVSVDSCTFLPPVSPTKVLAIGRNFAAHADEMGFALGATPSVFIKPLQSIIAHGEDVVLPPRRLSTHVEHEAEVAVVMGRTARNVSQADAADYVLGFTCADDVSARDLQKSDVQITRGKGFDTFCPFGPVIETDVSLDDDLAVTCHVNGELRQQGSLKDLIFNIPELIEWLSQWTTLVPGDIILTGSPAGTGPLTPGDTVRIEVAKVGVLEHGIVADPEDLVGASSQTDA